MIRSSLLVLMALAWCAPLGAAELSDQQVLDALTSEAPRDVAIRKGLECLRARQKPDGAFSDNIPAALTSLAVMAHLAAGITPDDPRQGPALRKAIGFVLGRQDENGYLGGRDGSRMYGHGMSTLMLAEALGMCRDEELDARIRVALAKAVAVTVGAARLPRDPAAAGGWHYTPDDRGADLSLSGWQLMSLHAAEQVGIAVPAEVIAGGVAYAKRLTTPDGKVGYDHPGDDHPPLRGLGMLCYAIGHDLEAKEVAVVAERIKNDPLAWPAPWLFYRAYYDAVGMSRSAPEQWDAYAPRLEQVLIEHQNADGSWPAPPGDDEGQHGPVYLTSMAILALTVQRHVLPAYQR